MTSRLTRSPGNPNREDTTLLLEQFRLWLNPSFQRMEVSARNPFRTFAGRNNCQYLQGLTHGFVTVPVVQQPSTRRIDSETRTPSCLASPCNTDDLSSKYALKLARLSRSRRASSTISPRQPRSIVISNGTVRSQPSCSHTPCIL